MTAAHASDDAGATPDWDAVEAEAEAREGRGSRRWWVIGGIAVVIMSALAAWWGVAATQGRVHWVDTGFQVMSGTQVDVRFDLRRDPDRAVVCQLEAQADSHLVVGRTEVTVPAGESSPSRHIESVRTASPAITGYVQQCWYADEAPRR